MKFPCLTLEQLKPLEKEFVSFLIVNGVEGDAWKLINETAPQKASELVELFSQLVWEKILQETHYVKRFSENERIVAYLGDKVGILIVAQNNTGQLSLHKGTKQWMKNREEEVMDLLTQGFERTSEEEFNALNELIKS